MTRLIDGFIYGNIALILNYFSSFYMGNTFDCKYNRLWGNFKGSKQYILYSALIAYLFNLIICFKYKTQPLGSYIFAYYILQTTFIPMLYSYTCNKANFGQVYNKYMLIACVIPLLILSLKLIKISSSLLDKIMILYTLFHVGINDVYFGISH